MAHNMTLEKDPSGGDASPVPDVDDRNGPAAPPSYQLHGPSEQSQQHELPEDLSARLSKLNLGQTIDLGTSSAPKISVSPDHCIAHLKLLEAFAQLREEVGSTENLFAIATPNVTPPSKNDTENSPAIGHIRVREKRWAVYVARAVDRFQKWWDLCVPATMEGAPCGRLTGEVLCTKKDIEEIPKMGKPIVQLGSKDRLPPLDVLMVWHSFMLNPRGFLEDCFRSGKMDFYATPFPWSAISECIDNVTFEFKAPEAAVANFSTATRCNWNNLKDPARKTFICPNCGKNVSVPWTAGYQWSSRPHQIVSGSGFADEDFLADCASCKLRITNDYLRAQKFRTDVQLLQRQDLPMPGTVLSRAGQPETTHTKLYKTQVDLYFPNLLLQEGLDLRVLEKTEPNNANASMEQIKQLFEAAVTDRALVRRAKTTRTPVLSRDKVAIRKCMSRYWYNSSPFALDLVGAVIRQGSFVDKMHNIDWLHSPALFSTMERLLVKYKRFFEIMKLYPRKVAVPTLDIDLAWHTHQLNAQAYYIYSDRVTSVLIDHDDKIEETKLTDAFAWTSKVYQEKYGETYSSCTCWYCEAVRESHTRTVDKLFKPRKSKALENLHASPDLTSSDPLKSPHISAHNAVRDTSDEAIAQSRVKAAELDKAYHKACARARKEKRKEPVRDDYFYAYAWGYPMAYPIYYPYAVPVGGCGAYTSVDTGTGAYGNCASGTCGGMAAFGGTGCSSVGGSCGGAGGCGSSGGCGGGGGGGGCGGGGGGGGG